MAAGKGKAGLGHFFDLSVFAAGFNLMHFAVQAIDHFAAGLFTNKRKYGVEDASNTGADHAEPKSEGAKHMLKIAFANGGRVFGKGAHIVISIPF